MILQSSSKFLTLFFVFSGEITILEGHEARSTIAHSMFKVTVKNTVYSIYFMIFIILNLGYYKALMRLPEYYSEKSLGKSIASQPTELEVKFQPSL